MSTKSAKSESMKQSIKEYLITYYNTHKEPPKAKNSDMPWSDKTVNKYFGSWAEALTACDIPLRVNKPLTIPCDQCGKSFKKKYSQYKKSNNHFCSNSCSASYSNSRRVISDETKQKLSNFNKLNAIVLPRSRYCTVCSAEFILKVGRDQRTICSDICRKKNQIANGKICGQKSQAAQPRRSKGEMLFYNLCERYFVKDDVLSNKQIFKDTNGNFWDADIIIPKYKLAICYNGIWHYEQIGKKHNLKQVQSRDRIKSKIIFNNGYSTYIVKDLGKFDQMFVYEQFHMFIFRTFILFEFKMNQP